MENLSIGCNYVFSIDQRVDQMGKVSEEHDWRNNQKRAKKGCMPLCYYLRSFILELVSTSRSKTTKEEVDKTTIGIQKEEGDFEGKVNKKQKTSKPCTFFS